MHADAAAAIRETLHETGLTGVISSVNARERERPEAGCMADETDVRHEDWMHLTGDAKLMMKSAMHSFQPSSCDAMRLLDISNITRLHMHTLNGKDSSLDLF